MNVAKKLTLDEIKALPRTSVIWYSYEIITDEGIMFHYAAPVMVCVPHENGCLIGGDGLSIFDRDIDDHLMDDDISFWDTEPNREQLSGITVDEYDDLIDVNRIVFPKLATAITSKGYTFETFSSATGLNPVQLWKSITGQREFTVKEIEVIVDKLNMSAADMREIFFPECAVQI